MVTFQSLRAQDFLAAPFVESSRIGINAGINSFSRKADFATTSPGTGWELGVIASWGVGEKFDVNLGFGIQRNTMSAIVRKRFDDSKEDSKEVELKIFNINYSLKGYYTLLNNDDNFMLRAGGGVFYNMNFGAKDMGWNYLDTGDRYLDDLILEDVNLIYGTLSVQAEYKKICFNIDYSRNIISPSSFSITDSLLSFTMTYYFKERY